MNKFITTPGHMINWYSTTIRLDPERLGDSYEQWLKTDDIYIVFGLNVVMVPLHVGKASECKVDGNRLTLPVPGYIDTTNKSEIAVYVTNMKSEDFIEQINRTIDAASKVDGAGIGDTTPTKP